MALLRNLRNRHPNAPRPQPVDAPTRSEGTPVPAVPDAGQVLPPGQSVMEGQLIKPILDDADRETERHRALNERTHVSGLLRDCGRMLQLAKQSPIPLYSSRPTGGHRVMWEIGRAVERHVRNTYIRKRNGENILGVWTCRCGSTRVQQMGFPLETCGVCGGPLHTYGELRLIDHDYNLTGHPDMVVLEAGALVVIEIKSMNQDEFEALTQPLGDHIAQAGLYRHMMIQDGQTMSRYVNIIYTNKRFLFGSPYKEYRVDMLAPMWANMIQMHLDAALAVSGPELLPRLRQCDNPTSSRPRNCPTCTDCFLRQG